jgi:hypothetical protein
MQLFRLQHILVAEVEDVVVLLATVVDYAKLRMRLVLLLLQLSEVPDHGEGRRVDRKYPSVRKLKTRIQKMITLPTRMTRMTITSPEDVAVVGAEAKAVEKGNEQIPTIYGTVNFPGGTRHLIF